MNNRGVFFLSYDKPLDKPYDYNESVLKKYFDEKNQKELVEKLYDSLEYGGYLFIGHSESIMRDDSSFKYVMPAVYKKI